MSFQTKLDYSSNRQIKQFKLTSTQLSGTTVFGIDDALIPMNFTGDTINIDALQYIQTRGLIFANPLPEFTGSTYQLLGRDNDTGKIVEITGISGGTSGTTSGTTIDTNDYVSGATFSASTGDLALYRLSGGTVIANLDGRYLTEIDITTEGTYAEIKAIRDAGNLIPGFRYIINDYQTEYFIDGSNSSDRVVYKTITSIISGYAVLDNNFDYDLAVGMTVEITALPDGYGGSLNVGDTTTVTVESVDYYWRFANGMQVSANIGVEFKYELTRYDSITGGTLVLDVSGNTVMQASGLTNTQVHTGATYMDQTASENLAVPVEEIVLLASAVDSFEPIGSSQTFTGDTIYYDMDDTDIYNDNREIIGTRKGLITRRINFEKTIDLTDDWRVKRWRRWTLDAESRQKFLNRDLVLDTLTAGTFTTGVTYQIISSGTTDFTTIGAADNQTGTWFIATGVGTGTGTAFAPTRTRASTGEALFTSDNRTSGSTDPFYISLTLEDTLMTLNFNAIRTTYGAVVLGNANAKDINIIPLDSNYNPVAVAQCIITNSCYNTVFRQLAGEFGYDLTVNIDGSVTYSTFVSPVLMTGKHIMSINKWIALDSINFSYPTVGLTINTVQSLSHCWFSKLNSSRIDNVIFGNLTSNLGNMAVTYTWTIIQGLNNTEIIDSAIGTRAAYMNFVNTKVNKSSIFAGSAWSGGAEDSRYAREETQFFNCLFSYCGIRLLNRTDRISFNDMKFPDTGSATGQPQNLFLYDWTNQITIKKLELNNNNFNIYRININANDEFVVVTEATPITT